VRACARNEPWTYTIGTDALRFSSLCARTISRYLKYAALTVGTVMIHHVQLDETPR
jgi:hypothetical protein